MMNQFPASFLWGASSSAFQIEGGWDEGGKGMTVADFNSFKLSDKQADTKVASDFYHHWKEDIDLMKELGLKAYRFSLSWARIIPDGDGEVNPEGIAFYNKVIDYLIEQGIRPLVTLYHFDLPYALVEKYNGWECRDCAYAFERYARVCFRAFGDRVKYWQVINEQNLMIRVNNRMNIYTNDEWEADRMRAQMDYHMFLAHALAVNACHELVEGGKIAAIDIVQQQETAGVGSLALDALPARIIEAQSTEVDAVAGATVSSTALKDAVNNALAQVK